jgi:hypothetical protein
METRSHVFLLFVLSLSTFLTGCGKESADQANDDSQQTEDEVAKPSRTEKTTSSDGLPSKGHWLGPDDPRLVELERQAAERRSQEPPDDPQYESLMAALKAKNGDFADALTAMGLHLDLDSSGRVTRIYDTMMNGQFDNEEFALLSQIPTLKRLGLDEADVTDDGLAALAKMPQLKRLSLYAKNITDRGLIHLRHLTQLEELFLQRLQDAGIDVSHGQLLNVRRKDNLLRYVGMDFEVDRDQSSLKAFLRAGQTNVLWALDIECTEKYVPSHMQPAHLEGPPMPSNKNWKDLVGEEFRISYKGSELHPILPDNPSNIYVGWHAAPNNHRIKFQKRIGHRFLIDWRCEAKESENDAGSSVWLYAEIPFTELTVWSDEPLSIDEAKRQASQQFDLADFLTLSFSM